MEPNPVQPPAPESAPAAPEVPAELTALYQQVKSGANWFYWIAGLSIINAVLAHSETKTQFVLGLAITQIVDAIAGQIAPNWKWFSLVFDAALAGALAFFGFKGGKAVMWAFLAGLSIFLIDCALFAWICLKFGEVEKGVILGGIFRALALFSIFGGISATKKLHALKAQLGATA